MSQEPNETEGFEKYAFLVRSDEELTAEQVTEKLEKLRDNEDPEIPAEFVAKYQPMDPETEFVVMAKDLWDGMIVVAASPTRRYDESVDAMDREKMWGFLVNNRWCRVTQRTSYNSEIGFVGVYSDGTQVAHQCSRIEGWVVKKATDDTEEQE